jgi:hypothetical protein
MFFILYHWNNSSKEISHNSFLTSNSNRSNSAELIFALAFTVSNLSYLSMLLMDLTHI